MCIERKEFLKKSRFSASQVQVPSVTLKNVKLVKQNDLD